MGSPCPRASSTAGALSARGEPRLTTIGDWFRQILDAAGSAAELVRVPEHALPADLAISGSHPQHLHVSVALAERLIGWAPGDPAARVAESVRWHLANPSPNAWTPEESAADDAALAAAHDWLA
ncbi:hypothetical protein CLV63_12622 [Murinocardiopsis flavida]|uniref:Uncharacterized protein n=1 Tax=Murinocardiopsis flavida TaxID=645275 RepID=A0A2P8CWS5_9ACTN|nr:hypothetical protein [Murinocardiopsis flavida]PSK89386.1 hypothetical protein CLV63_12622 [Murinocardiopsis flavida]